MTIENTKKNLEAPVYKNTQISKMFVNIGDKELIKAKIVINEYIKIKGIKEYIIECLKSIM